MLKEYTKMYGVISGLRKGKYGYFVTLEGDKTSLHYATHELALRKAKEFCQSVYKDFVDFNGNNVKFHYQQEVQPLGK